MKLLNYYIGSLNRQRISQNLVDLDFDYIDSIDIEDLAKNKHLQIDHGMYGCAPSHFTWETIRVASPDTLLNGGDGYFNKKKEEREP